MTVTAPQLPLTFDRGPRFGISPATIDTARTVRRGSEAAAASRRRRLLAVAALVGLGLVAGHAGTALGGSSLAAPERIPQAAAGRLVTHVVAPGDTLWSIAQQLAPERDPRAVVDAIVLARGSATIHPGETITWLAD